MKKTTISIITLCLLIISCKKERVPEKKEPTEKPPQVSIKDYVSIVQSKSGHVLKNGKRLFLASIDKSRQLYLQSENTKKYKNISKSNDAVDQYYVSPDEKSLIFLTSQGGNEQYDITLIDLETLKKKPILFDSNIKYDNCLWLDNSRFFYTANEIKKKDFYIYLYNTETGKKTLLVEKSGFNIPTAAKSEKEFLFYTYKGNNTTIPYLVTKGKTKPFKKIKKNKLYIPVGYLNDKIVMKTNEEQEFAYISIWSKNISSKTLFKTDWPVENIIIDKKKHKSLVFTVNEEGISNTYIYKHQKIEKLPFPKGVISLNQFKDNLLVYTPSTANTIPHPIQYKVDEKTSIPFGYTDSGSIDTKDFVMPILKKTKSFDKTEIPYFVYIPKNSKPPYKTIMYFHGGPASQFRPYFITSFQYYVSQGYMVVAPNVRGSSGYGQVYENMDNYKKRMDSVKDGQAVVKDLINQKLTTHGKISSMGGSYGGFMSVASMATYPDTYICGINSVGIADYVNFLTNTKSYRRKLREVEYGPLSDKKFLSSISPVNMTDKIKGKLFVAHGANDPRVPVTDAFILIENMKKKGKSVESIIFPDEGHGVRKKHNRIKYYETIAAFLKGCYN